ncbi:hypothetical protein GCM10022415_31160 [Knoellia locipacati]|uniref:Uncharacterized protein n=1 Tax=Knoellia locipacati TaxID=882824 RepID=A0A512T3S9_9MICO|nr:hypothetical protein KLO01_29270 [Knoellia locipacati]
MVEPDWGVDDPEGSFGSSGLPWEPVYSDSVEDVLEVQAARSSGFRPAHEAPLWCFIPAIWPARERSWVRDVRVRHMTRAWSDGRTERLPWTTAEYAELEADINALLHDVGLPPRPAGRIWLLRPPPTYATAQEALDEVWADWLASGGVGTVTPELVAHTDTRLRRLFS